MSTLTVSPGERYYDRMRDEELLVLDALPRLNQILIEIEGSVQEIRPLGKFLASLRRGRIVSIEESRPAKESDGEH